VISHQRGLTGAVAPSSTRNSPFDDHRDAFHGLEAFESTLSPSMVSALRHRPTPQLRRRIADAQLTRSRLACHDRSTRSCARPKAARQIEHDETKSDDDRLPGLGEAFGFDLGACIVPFLINTITRDVSKRRLPEAWKAIIGLIFVLVVLYLPRGLAPCAIVSTHRNAAGFA